MSALRNGAGRYLGHHYAQWQVEDEHRVVVVAVTYSDEVGLTHEASLGIQTESESHNKEGQWWDGNH